jgi:hypothetical protein
MENRNETLQGGLISRWWVSNAQVYRGRLRHGLAPRVTKKFVSRGSTGNPLSATA